MTDLAEVIADEGIRMTATHCGQRLRWETEVDHWRCVLKRSRVPAMTIDFYMGVGREGRRPSTVDVLECLLDDADGVEQSSGDFEEWAQWFGFDSDSRKAEQMFIAVRQQTERLEAFLGPLLEVTAALLDTIRVI